MDSILLISCYELGHQPLSLAWPLAVLRGAGLSVTAVDLAVEPLPKAVAQAARFVAIAVPMHTALRIGVDAARRVRRLNPQAHICCYGLYAWLNREYLLGEGGVADSVLAGEMEPTLLALAQAFLAGGDPAAVPGVTTAAHTAPPQRIRLHLPLPNRSSLPALHQYAAYIDAQGGHSAGLSAGHRAGYVEASRGCLHTCRHCPIVPVYGGRFFVVPADVVLADIRQQVEAGAEHITFGDPDFLNGPGHALAIAERLHREFPGVTFDFTAKVEHLLEHSKLLPRLADCGATFVVSAFESTSDESLARLAKGHTVADMERALELLARAGLAPQPTWMPFTPWTSLADYLHLLSWIRKHGLIPYVPAVQLSIRMLIPPASALLADCRDAPWLGELDAANFGYRWTHPDPAMDELHAAVTCIAEEAGDDDPFAAFAAVERAAYAAAGQPAPEPALRPWDYSPPPRLSEHWFC